MNWIPVSERLPEVFRCVPVWMGDLGWHDAYLNPSGTWLCDNECLTPQPTHWLDITPPSPAPDRPTDSDMLDWLEANIDRLAILARDKSVRAAIAQAMKGGK